MSGITVTVRARRFSADPRPSNVDQDRAVRKARAYARRHT